MKYTETLDHAPAAVELERLPDGTAWLRMHKDVVQGKTEAPEGEEGGPCWTATTAVAQLGTDRAAETVESITANLDDWWTYAEAWEEQPPMTLNQRMDAVETALADIVDIMTGGAET